MSDYPKCSKEFRSLVNSMSRRRTRNSYAIDIKDGSEVEYSLGNIFSKASGEVKFYTESFGTESSKSKFFYENLFKYLSNPTNRLSLIIDNPKSNSEPLRALLAYKYSIEGAMDRISIQVLNQKDLRPAQDKDGALYHFIVAPNLSTYLIEVKANSDDSELGFYNEEATDTLEKVFNLYSEHSDPLDTKPSARDNALLIRKLNSITTRPIVDRQLEYA